MDDQAKILKIKEIRERFKAQILELKNKKQAVINDYRKRLEEAKLAQVRDSISK